MVGQAKVSRGKVLGVQVRVGRERRRATSLTSFSILAQVEQRRLPDGQETILGIILNANTTLP
jgi:hypothetical protein